MINLWQMYRGKGFAAGHLPEAGGPLDQAALMMSAFDVMDDELRKHTNGSGSSSVR